MLIRAFFQRRRRWATLHIAETARSKTVDAAVVVRIRENKVRLARMQLHEIKNAAIQQLYVFWRDDDPDAF